MDERSMPSMSVWCFIYRLLYVVYERFVQYKLKHNIELLMHNSNSISLWACIDGQHSEIRGYYYYYYCVCVDMDIYIIVNEDSAMNSEAIYSGNSG